MPCAEDKEFNGVDRIVEENFALGVDPIIRLPEKDVRTPVYHSFNPLGIPNILENMQFHKISLFTGQHDFVVRMDVSHFKPNELSVKVVDETVVVQGKHGERKDDHGFIQRQFVRLYNLPERVDGKDVVSMISTDGVLTIRAPVPPFKPKHRNERIVEIQPTGCSHKMVKQPQELKNQQNGIRDTNEGINQTQKRDPAHVIVKQAEESKNQKNEETDNISKGNPSVKQPEESKNQQNEKNNII